MSVPERFSSRWGLILSVIGIAVGTGNIWRFPRIAASNGGGTFLIPWVVFLFLWSIPLIMAEFAIGKKTRQGTVGSFSQMMGSRFAWMGGYIGVVAVCIMFYYSVVAGWCIRYFLLAASGQLLSVSDHSAHWESFTGSQWQPIVFHFAAISICVLVVSRGVVSGIERVNRVLVPSLLLLIVVSAVRAVTLPGAFRGLEFLFTPNFSELTNAAVWLQALTQNAWDTGAGWGLILTYAVYMRRHEDVPLNAALIGFGNNSVSLLAGITVFCTVFALAPGNAEELIRTPGPANTGLTFIWIPQLFAQMPAASLFAVMFFLALSFAAVSSLISMVELATRILIDMNLTRRRAILVVYGGTFLFGLPSALSADIFLNQDWVWGMGLILAGLFMALIVIRYGANRFRHELINESGDIHIGRWWSLIVKYLIPLQVVVLITWWFAQAITADPENWWNPLVPESVGTCLFQWGIVVLLLISMNSLIVKRTVKP